MFVYIIIRDIVILLLKALKFIGAHWILIPVGITVAADKIMGGAPAWISVPCKYVAVFCIFVVIPLTTIQNIIRFFWKKEFNIFNSLSQLVTKRKTT